MLQSIHHQGDRVFEVTGQRTLLTCRTTVLRIRLPILYLTQFCESNSSRSLSPVALQTLTFSSAECCLLDNSHLWMSLQKEKLQECHFSSAGVTAWSQMFAAGCGSTKWSRKERRKCLIGNINILAKLWQMQQSLVYNNNYWKLQI